MLQAIHLLKYFRNKVSLLFTSFNKKNNEKVKYFSPKTPEF